MMIPGFHLKDGLYFTREVNGDVTIRWYCGEVMTMATRVDGSAWASAVASMSRLGETSDIWRAALALHEGATS